MDAAFPVLYVHTFEEEKAKEAIQNASESVSSISMLEWDGTDRICDPRTGEVKYDVSTYSLADILDDRMDYSTRQILILRNLDTFLDDPGVMARLKKFAEHIHSGQLDATIFLLSPILNIPRNFEKYITVVEMDYLQVDEIRSIIRNFTEVQEIQISGSLEKELATAFKGLSEFEIQNIYLCGDQFDIPVSQCGVHYKGITNPTIHLTGKLPEDMEETGITFENCTVENMPESFPNRIDAFLQWAYEKWACSNMNPLKITIQFQAREKPVSMKPETISGNPEELMEQLTEKSQWCVQSSIASDNLIDSFQLTVANTDPSPKTSNLKHSFTAAISTETACAEVADVEAGRGLNGYRSLDVVLKNPVILSGTKYNRIRLISLTAFQKLSLRHDAIVNVRLVGNAIPVLTVKENGTGLGIARPSRCPYCASILEVRNHKLFCSNLFCSENISDRFSNFFKQIGLPQYAGLLADTLEQDFGCHNLADLVYLTKEKIESPNIYTQDLVHLPQQLREAIKTKRDYEILAAMGIPGLGSVQARRIIEQCAFTVLGEQTMSTYSILVSTALGIKDQTVLNIISSSAFANEVNALAKLEYIKTETLDPVTRYLRDSHTNEGTSTDRTATYISRLLKDTGFLGFNGRKER